jgi:hypothetical protein
MSLTRDKGSRLRYRVEEYLTACGIRRTGTTGTWEGRAVSADEAGKQFQKVFALLSDPAKIPGIGQAQLDHLWVYINRAKKAKVASPTA